MGVITTAAESPARPVTTPAPKPANIYAIHSMKDTSSFCFNCQMPFGSGRDRYYYTDRCRVCNDQFC